MNTALPEMMLHSLDTTENTGRNGGGTLRMTVRERQQARIRWQEEQLQQPPTLVQMTGLDYCNSSDQLNIFSTPVQAQHFHRLIMNDQNLGGLLTAPMESDRGVQSSACNNFVSIGGDSVGFGACELGNVTGFGIFNTVSRNASCPPAVAAALAEAASAATKRKEMVLPEKLSSTTGRESSKKRKADKPHNPKVVAEEQSKDNKMKGCTEEEESKETEQKSKNISTNNNNDTEPSETSKENSKISEVQKQDYIHVRARRGQATDSHSLAERVRREKISERMKYLQDLVPGCNKITGKAGMLDEIINYVQSLQRQVEFLSMKLAAVNPRLDLDMDNIFSKEIFPVGASEPHAIEESSEMNNPPNFHFAPLEQVVSCCGLETDKTNPPEMALRQTITAPVSIPEILNESPYLSQIYPYSTWDAELQSLYTSEFQPGKSTLLLSQPCTGFSGGSNVKIEM